MVRKGSSAQGSDFHGGRCNKEADVAKRQMRIISHHIRARKAHFGFLSQGSEHRWPDPEEIEILQCGADSQILGHPLHASTYVSLSVHEDQIVLTAEGTGNVMHSVLLIEGTQKICHMMKTGKVIMVECQSCFGHHYMPLPGTI